MPVIENGKTRKPDLFTLMVAWQFVAAFLWFIGIIAAIIFTYPFSPGYEGSSVEIGDVFGMILGSLFLLGSMSLAIAGGIGLVGRKKWGRLISIINSVLSLFIIPLGTIAGILAIIYLMKPEVKDYLVNQH